MSHFIRIIKIVPSATANPVYQKTTSTRPEEQARASSRSHFGPSYSSRCRTLAMAFCGSEAPIPTMHAHCEVFHFHYWIPFNNGILRYLESITLPDHSHILNAIMPPIHRRPLQTEKDIFFMSITIIKCSNLVRYKRITMCKSCGYEDPHDLHYQL